MYGDPPYVVLRQLYLASVHANAHWNVKPMQRVANGARAVDRSRRAIEGRQETVAQGFPLPSAKARKLPANRLVMSFEEVAPSPIAPGVRAPGRIDDIGEYDGSKHPVDDGG